MDPSQPIQTTETPPLVTPEVSSPIGNDSNPSPSTKNKSVVLILVLLILGLLILLFYLFYQNTQLKQQVKLVELDKPTIATCEYDGQTYEAGEGFAPSDGCNSCLCKETGKVVCTTTACDIANPTTSPVYEPVTITPDQSGLFYLNSTRLGFSSSFSAQNVVATNCHGAYEGYEFWIYSSDADTRAGVCSYEGPAGIIMSQIEDASQIECWPNDETYSVQKSTKTINTNSVTYCESTLRNSQPEIQEPALTSPILSAFVKNPNADSVIWVWTTDPKLKPVFDQILSTFEFTD